MNLRTPAGRGKPACPPRPRRVATQRASSPERAIELHDLALTPFLVFTAVYVGYQAIRAATAWRPGTAPHWSPVC